MQGEKEVKFKDLVLIIITNFRIDQMQNKPFDMILFFMYTQPIWH